MERATSGKPERIRDVKLPVCNAKLPARRCWRSSARDKSATRRKGRLNSCSRFPTGHFARDDCSNPAPIVPVRQQTFQGAVSTVLHTLSPRPGGRVASLPSLRNLASPVYAYRRFPDQTLHNHRTTSVPGIFDLPSSGPDCPQESPSSQFRWTSGS